MSQYFLSSNEGDQTVLNLEDIHKYLTLPLTTTPTQLHPTDGSGGNVNPGAISYNIVLGLIDLTSHWGYYGTLDFVTYFDSVNGGGYKIFLKSGSVTPNFTAAQVDAYNISISIPTLPNIILNCATASQQLFVSFATSPGSHAYELRWMYRFMRFQM